MCIQESEVVSLALWEESNEGVWFLGSPDCRGGFEVAGGPHTHPHGMDHSLPQRRLTSQLNQ